MHFFGRGFWFIDSVNMEQFITYLAEKLYVHDFVDDVMEISPKSLI